jgi:predicted P-loop ATPase
MEKIFKSLAKGLKLGEQSKVVEIDGVNTYAKMTNEGIEIFQQMNGKWQQIKTTKKNEENEQELPIVPPPTQEKEDIGYLTEIKVSKYKNALDNKGVGDILLDVLFKDIKSKKYKPQTAKLRTLQGEAASEYKKANFEAVTFSGTFAPTRQKKNLQTHSGLLCLDFDKLPSEGFAQIVKNLQEDKHTFFAFISPSGNGIKVGVRLQDCAHEEIHLQYFQIIETYYREKFGLQIDKACKNVDRLCFLPYDESLFLNESATPFRLSAPPPSPQGSKTPQKTPINANIDNFFAWCLEQHQKSNEFVKGNRNQFINKLAWYCNEKGLDKAICLEECLHHFVEADFTAEEITRIVENVYTNHTDKHNSLPYETTPKKPQKQVEDKAKNSKEARINYEARNETNESQPRFIKIRNYLLGQYDFRNNIVSNDLLYRPKNKGDFKKLNENDLLVELYEQGFKGFEKELSALMKSSIVEEYNPFQDYFDNLPTWKEGDKDYISHLASCVEATNQKFFNYHFKKMLVRVIAQALEIIPFNKHCFVLTSPPQTDITKQSVGKTSFLRFLTPQKLINYKAENINLQTKDGLFALYQNLFINFDEVDKFTKYETGLIKAFLTNDKVKDRLPFDRKPSVFPRRASFVASTNHEEILIDETGSVRWLMFEAININWKEYTNHVDMDLVYSQAYALLKNGFVFDLTKEDIEESERNNRKHQVSTPEMDLLMQHYAPASKENHDGFLTTTDILEVISKDHHTIKLNGISLGRALKFLGYEQGQKFMKECNYQQKGYYVKFLK